MRRRIALLVAVGAALIMPASALASFHLMKVREVYPGDSSDPNAIFIELQMYAAGQNFVAGKQVTTEGGSETGHFSFASDVANGQSQRSILVATAEAEAKFGVTADLRITPVKAPFFPSRGAVCFESVDCMAWGSFSPAGLPSPSGSNAPAIPDGMSLTRSIAAGCPTLLEAGDDTDDSASDFAPAPPSPRDNSTAPTESSCAGPGPDPDPDPDPDPGPADTTVDGAKLKARGRQNTADRRPKVLAKAKLGEEGRVKVVARAKLGGKTYKLKKSTDLAAGDAEKLKLKAKGRAKRKISKALRKGKRVKVKLIGKFTDTAGNRTTEKARTKLK